jgi:hypothetical protein
MSQKPLSWADNYASMLSEESIQILFPAPKYRVAIKTFPIGTKLPGRMREGTCFVISGAVIFNFPNLRCEIKAGFFCPLPAGDYEVEINNNIETKYAIVWDLEQLMNAEEGKIGQPQKPSATPGVGK